MPRGGYRIGAGRPGWTLKVEECRQLDVRRLQREDMLRAGWWSWQWTNRETGNVVASVGIRGGADRVTLEYSKDERSIVQSVEIERTPCHFGKSRPWFLCPRCGGRVALLYLRRSGFACRTCQHLAYRSQSEDEIGRTWLKQCKLEARLGDHWQRPKGMHKATRDRLVDRIIECESRRDDAIAYYLDRMGWPA